MDESRQLLRNRMIARIDHISRLGEPFTWKQIPNKELIELATRVDEERPNWVLNQDFNIALGLVRFRGTLWRRYDVATGKAERRDGNIVLYPSNDRERFHLKENEKLLPHHITGGTLRKAVEPPVRLGTVEPTASIGSEHPSPATAAAGVDWRSLALSLADTTTLLAKQLDTIVGSMGDRQ